VNDSSFPTETTARQHTVKAPISCVGIGLHTGRKLAMTIRPAPADHGVVFRRVDAGPAEGSEILARFDRVADTRLCTALADPAHPAARIGTIEHLMAAFAGLGVDNALVEIDGPELPILDGSALSLVFLLDCAGLRAQAAPRRAIEILRPVRVADGDGFAELRPPTHAGDAGFALTLSIDFPAAAIGQQSYALRLTPENFRRDLAPARTFALLHEVDALHRAGLAQGGSLENAVVVDGHRVLNPTGLRMPDEFVRHKLLDVVGDLALAGAPLHGRFVGHRTGHALNNRLLRTLLADDSAWRFAAAEPISGFVAPPLQAVAA
jgi:UDP-3-O-[3-hydroxymyristoyl] N-acetylglucosamine deacetylase